MTSAGGLGVIAAHDKRYPVMAARFSTGTKRQCVVGPGFGIDLVGNTIDSRIFRSPSEVAGRLPSIRPVPQPAQHPGRL